MKWNEETAKRDTVEVEDSESVFGLSLQPPDSYILTNADERLVHFCRTYLSVISAAGWDATEEDNDPNINWFGSSIGKGDRNLAWGILTSFLYETTDKLGSHHNGLSSLSDILKIATDEIELDNADLRVRNRMDDLMNVLSIMYFG